MSVHVDRVLVTLVHAVRIFVGKESKELVSKVQHNDSSFRELLSWRHVWIDSVNGKQGIQSAHGALNPLGSLWGLGAV